MFWNISKQENNVNKIINQLKECVEGGANKCKPASIGVKRCQLSEQFGALSCNDLDRPKKKVFVPVQTASTAAAVPQPMRYKPLAKQHTNTLATDETDKAIYKLPAKANYLLINATEYLARPSKVSLTS